MQDLSEKHLKKIRKNPSQENWNYKLSRYNFTEDLLREFHKEISRYWNTICLHQKLSESFLIEFIDKIAPYCLKYNNEISKEIKDKIIAMKELMNQ